MTRNPMMKTAVAAAVLLAASGLALSSAGPGAAPAQAGKTAVLEYKMPAGRVLTYQTKSEMGTAMEVMGQSMDSTTTQSSTFRFASKGPKGKDLLLGVTVDDMTMSVTGAQGDMSPDLSPLKGKSFDLVLSPLGSEIDVTGAEALEYSIASETRNLGNEFKQFFPDMPGKPVKIGDTWPSNVSIEERMSALTVRIDLQYVNTLEGFEAVDGMECARIGARMTGTISGSGNQMGQDVTFTGTTKGQDVYHFAVKEGVFVKAVSESTAEIAVDVPAAGMSIPMTQSTKGEVKLAAKN
ncbi:MAG TPA: hypothetical protein PLP83_04255 [Candidatus Aminicenantes bacterium]|nr:hypothetical protein [Candidatus Aminicenantes bacterium]